LSRSAGSFVTLSIAKTGGSVQLLSPVTATPAGAANALEFNGTTDVLDLNGQTLTLNGPIGGTDASGSFKGSATSNLSLQGAGNAGTLRFAAGAQSLGNLTLNKTGATGGATLATPVTVNGVLALTSGLLTTGANTLTVGPSGSVTRGTGYVVGTLAKRAALGTTALVFEIGTATNYLPVSTAFDNVTVAGDLAASTTAGEHPSIATSGLEPTKSVNRYYTLAGPSITFTTYSATFTYPVSDRDAAANADSVEARGFSGGTWIPLTPGTRPERRRRRPASRASETSRSRKPRR
jgi:hypothetical protein